MSGLKVGDKVKCIRTHKHNTIPKGYTGTVAGVKGVYFCIEYDNYIDGHGSNMVLNGRGRSGHCWNYTINQVCFFKIISKSNKSKKYK